jgi:hypothetical protein
MSSALNNCNIFVREKGVWEGNVKYIGRMINGHGILQ